MHINELNNKSLYKGWFVCWNSGNTRAFASRHGVDMNGNSREMVYRMIDRRKENGNDIYTYQN